MTKQTGCSGGRRRRSKKYHRRRTRRGGMFASATGPVNGQGGQPAGMEFRGAMVSGTEAGYNTGAPAGQTGGRRRRRSRRSRRTRRMRGGGGTGGGGDLPSRIFAGFEGDTVGSAGAVRVMAPAGSQG